MRIVRIVRIVRMKKFMKPKEFGFKIAEELNISQKAGYNRAWRACKNRDVICKQIGRNWLIDTQSIKQYLDGYMADYEIRMDMKKTKENE